ncbi:MAG: hypothetical protein II690_07725, partial [Ruminococcus sp.]|nr:hypothetical protein [Ruminococcus sp.]
DEALDILRQQGGNISGRMLTGLEKRKENLQVKIMELQSDMASCRVFPSFQPFAENSPISERLNDCGTLSHTLQEALPLDSGREQAAPSTHAKI